jgi:G3E family GTPase
MMFAPPPTPEAKLPVTILTGFLGSGKTTLLNHILHENHTRKIAVLVNEFGDINIDSQMLVEFKEDMVELTNGCICCTLNDGLQSTVWKILARREAVDYLLVETTGIADPLPIILTFTGSELWSFTRLDSIVTLVDATAFTAEHFDSQAAYRQITYGDILLLNKTDLVSEAQLRSLESTIHKLKSGARILHSSYGKVPLELLLDIQLTDLAAFSEAKLSSTHLVDDGFATLSFQSDHPFSLRKFQQFLDYQLSAQVFRAKGILWFAESPDRHLFQLSGKRYNLEDSSWNEKPSNQLVCIGRHFNKLELLQQLNNCLA